MRIVGLKANDPTAERYQLWIIDERGIEQRVSGGLFDVASTGEVVVPFKPELKIKGAAIFAITIEKPEGVVVSDMSRRACWAVAPPAKS
jgi:anti-sigma-K factor RskA